VDPDNAESFAMRVAGRYNARTARNPKEPPDQALEHMALEEVVDTLAERASSEHPELADPNPGTMANPSKRTLFERGVVAEYRRLRKMGKSPAEALVLLNR
jgi:hypothetical protein